MRVVATVLGNLGQMLEAEERRARRAIETGIRETAEGLRQDLKAHMKEAGLPGLAPVWKMKFLPGRHSAWNSAAFVYPDGVRVREAIWAFENGATIRAAGGRHLAIPTGYNKPRGWRKSGAKPLISAKDMAAMKRWSFVKKTKDGRGLVWFLRVTRAQEQTKRGKVRDLAYAGGVRMVGSGRVRRTKAILEAGAVPMFLLLPQVRLAKRLDIAGIVGRWKDKLVERVIQAWEEADDGR